MDSLTPTVQRNYDDATDATTTVVRYWSVYEQRWVEALPRLVPDAELAAMSAEARAIVEQAQR